MVSRWWAHFNSYNLSKTQGRKWVRLTLRMFVNNCSHIRFSVNWQKLTVGWHDFLGADLHFATLTEVLLIYRFRAVTKELLIVIYRGKLFDVMMCANYAHRMPTCFESSFSPAIKSGITPEVCYMKRVLVNFGRYVCPRWYYDLIVWVRGPDRKILTEDVSTVSLWGHADQNGWETSSFFYWPNLHVTQSIIFLSLIPLL